jgi:two-component sensor histidine kinase
VGLPAHLHIDQARTLGLRLVRTLVEQLDGSLALEEGPGAGIRIEFETLPEA